MSRIITEIAQEIVDLQDGGADAIEDIAAAVQLVLRGVYAAGYVVAFQQQEITISSVINFEELEG